MTKPPVENTTVNASDWEDAFHTISELEQGDVRMLIDEIMPEGVNILASLAGVGKTWLALSMARALSTGTPFLGKFKVRKTIPVLYLVPEVGGRAFRKRCEKMGIPDSPWFMCRTLRDGLMKLADEKLKAAVRDLEPVVFLDSMIRFQTGDESSSSANATGLAAGIFGLLHLGSSAVVGLHHSSKDSGKDPDMTLENVLRGSGDIGAMCDAVWGLEHARRRDGRKWDKKYTAESKALTRITVECVKPRDFEPAEQFVIQGKPFIDEQGDFEITSEGGVSKLPARQQEHLAIMLDMIRKDSRVSIRKITKATGWNNESVRNHAGLAGYSRNGNDEWIKGAPRPVGASLLGNDDDAA